MNLTDWISVLSTFYQKNPFLVQVTIALVIVGRMSLIFFRYMNEGTLDIRFLETDHQNTVKVIFTLCIFGGYIISTEIFLWGYPVIDTSLQLQSEKVIEASIFVFCIFTIFLFVGLLAVKKIGSQRSASTIEQLTIVFKWLLIQISVIIGTYSFGASGTIGLPLVILCALGSVMASIILFQSKVVEYSHVKISNGEKEYFVYSKNGNYYMCGKGRSSNAYGGIIVLSNDTIVEENYVIYPLVGIEHYCTKELPNNKTNNKNKRSYGIYVRNRQQGVPIKDIRIHASFRNIFGKELDSDDYDYPGPIESGEEKIIKVINSKKGVFQCDLDVIDYSMYFDETNLSNDKQVKRGKKPRAKSSKVRSIGESSNNKP